MSPNPTPHPLLLPPVVQKLVHHLLIRDLLTSRLVCKEWNSRACFMLRQTKTLKFRTKSESLSEYTSLMRKSVDLPYSNYELEFFDMEDPIVEDFINTCGKSTLSLQLNNCRCSIPNLWRILGKLKQTLQKFSIVCDPIVEDRGKNLSEDVHIPTLPNLKSLTLFGEFCTNADLIRGLLLSAPQLRSIHFKCFDYSSQDSPFEALCLKVLLEKEIHLPNLLSFKMDSRISDFDLIRLHHKSCNRLESLHLNLKWDVQPHSLERLLENLSRTLVNLELQFPIADQPDPVLPPPPTVSGSREEIATKRQKHEVSSPDSDPTLPRKFEYALPSRMSMLERLSLTNFQGSLTFLSHCEKLKYLFFRNCDASLATLKFVKTHSSLSCFMSSTLLDPSTCRRIATTFPNLRTLKVIVDDEVMGTIFEVLTDLHELILSGQNLTDSGIIGTFSDLHKIGESNYCPVKRPGIDNLKELRKLCIHNAGSITDASILEGITSCSQLTEISLLNAEVTDISLVAIGNRLRKLKKLELLSNVPQLTSSGKAYIRQQIPNCDFILGQRDILNLYRPRRPSGSDGDPCTSPMEILLGLFC